MKKCSYCEKEKPESFFSKDKKGKDGLNKVCKSCIKLRNKGYKADD